MRIVLLFLAFLPYIGFYSLGLKYEFFLASILFIIFASVRGERITDRVTLYSFLVAVPFILISISEGLLITPHGAAITALIYVPIHFLLIRAGKLFVVDRRQLNIVVRIIAVFIFIFILLSALNLEYARILNIALTGQARGMGTSRGIAFFAPEPGLSAVGISLFLFVILFHWNKISNNVIYSFIGLVALVMTDSGTGYLLIGYYFIVVFYMIFSAVSWRRKTILTLGVLIVAFGFVHNSSSIVFDQYVGGIGRLFILFDKISSGGMGDGEDSVSKRFAQLFYTLSCGDANTCASADQGYSVGVAPMLMVFGSAFFGILMIFLFNIAPIFIPLYILLTVLVPFISPSFFLIGMLSKSKKSSYIIKAS